MESLHALEVDGGPEPVRAAFIRFLRDPDPWLVENGWPVRKFMKAWMLYDYSQDDVPDEVAALRETINAGAETGQGSISIGGGRYWDTPRCSYGQGNAKSGAFGFTLGYVALVPGSVERTGALS